MKIRFRKGLPAYEQGKIYDLPEELCQHYRNAGIAELVDVAATREASPPAEPAAAEETEEPEGVEDDEAEAKPKKRRSKKAE